MKLNIVIILGSIRQDRNYAKVGKWIAKKIEDGSSLILD